MSITYNLTTNFAEKDTLPENDSAKVIRGSEFQAEYLAIKAAFASAAPTASPSFTGTATFNNVEALNLTVTNPIVADVTGSVTGGITGDVTGNLTGNVTGDVTGDVTGTVLTASQPNITSVGTLADFTSTGIDDNASSTALTIDTSGNVGIGISGALTASSKLQVNASSSAAQHIAAFTNENMSFSTAAGAYISIGDGTVVSRSMDIGINTDGAGEFDGSIVVNEPGGALDLGVANSTQAVRINSSGNVGIGTSSPAQKFVVSDTSSFCALAITASTTKQAHIFFGDQNDIDAGRISYANDIDALIFSNNGNQERMRIDSSGNVGIGTSSPSQKLHVRGSSAASVVALVQNINLTNECGSRLTLATSTNPNRGGYIEGVLESGADTGGQPSSLIFGTNTAFNDATERMRIDSSGNLLVGATTLPSVSTPGGAALVPDTNLRTRLELGVNASAFQRLAEFYNPNGRVGDIATSGSSTIYATSSDVRLKENIVDAPSASSDVDAIQIRSYDWKADGSHQKYGVIAQELVAVAPEAVSQGETEDDTWGVDYSKLVPMMIKEIQELRARVAQLENGV